MNGQPGGFINSSYCCITAAESADEKKLSDFMDQLGESTRQKQKTFKVLNDTILFLFSCRRVRTPLQAD